MSSYRSEVVSPEDDKATPLNRLRLIDSETAAIMTGDPSLGLTFAAYGCHGEGSCFFHSVLVGLNAKNYIFMDPDEQLKTAQDFRCSFSKRYDRRIHLELQRKTIDKEAADIPMETRVKQLCNPDVVADETAIRLVMDSLGWNIVFFDAAESYSMYCGVNSEDPLAKPTLLVRWVLDNEHFEPIVIVKSMGPESWTIQTMLEPAKNPQDRELVSKLMNQYSKTCGPDPAV